MGRKRYASATVWTCGDHRRVVADLQPVIDQVRERQRDGEKARLDVLEQIALIADERRHLDRMRSIGAYHGVIAVFVGAQNRMRVVVLTGQQSVQVGRIAAAGVGW